MDPARSKFGNGPKELCRAVDLLSHYKLSPHHEIFCKRSLPLSLSETPYLRNVVGEKKISKGEGMELDQLLRETSSQRDVRVRLQPFQLDILREAFQITETITSNHSYMERGIHLSAPELKLGSKKERKHKRHEDQGTEKEKVLKKHKQHNKDASMLKEKGDNRIFMRKFNSYQLVKQQNNGFA